MKIEGSGSIIYRHGSADPDSYQNVMDPHHWFKALSDLLIQNTVIPPTGTCYISCQLLLAAWT
jgi:hypothetical protein